MSTMVRCIGILGVSTVLLASGCTSGDDEGMGEAGSDGSSTTAATGTSAAMTTTSAEETGESGDDDGDVSSGDPGTSGGPDAGESTSEGGAGSEGSDTGSEVVFDEEFVWVADFLRTNCVACHSTDMNGNLLLPSVDISNDEIRLALDGVVATTGLLLVEPFDREASQTWLQITNEFGAQFPVEDTDRFGAWIDAGAKYYAD